MEDNYGSEERKQAVINKSKGFCKDAQQAWVGEGRLSKERERYGLPLSVARTTECEGLFSWTKKNTQKRFVDIGRGSCGKKKETIHPHDSP